MFNQKPYHCVPYCSQTKYNDNNKTNQRSNLNLKIYLTNKKLLKRNVQSNFHSSEFLSDASSKLSIRRFTAFQICLDKLLPTSICLEIATFNLKISFSGLSPSVRLRLSFYQFHLFLWLLLVLSFYVLCVCILSFSVFSLYLFLSSSLHRVVFNLAKNLGGFTLKSSSIFFRSNCLKEKKNLTSSRMGEKNGRKNGQKNGHTFYQTRFSSLTDAYLILHFFFSCKIFLFLFLSSLKISVVF